MSASSIHPSVRAIIPDLSILYRGQSVPLHELFAAAMEHLSHVERAEREEALNKLSAIVEQARDFALGYFTVARLHFEQGRMDHALHLAEQAVLKEPRLLPYRLLHMALLVGAQRGEEAQTLFAQLADMRAAIPLTGVHRFPESGDDFVGYMNEALPSILADHFIHDGRLRSSADIMNDVLSNAGTLAADELVAVLKDVVKFCPYLGEAWFWLINSLRRSGDAEAASAYCRKRLDGKPTDWPVQIQAGVLAGDAGDYITAFQHFDAAADRNPNLPVFSEGLLTANSKRAVVDWYKAILDRVPMTPDGYATGWGNFPVQPSLSRTKNINNPTLGESFTLASADLRDGLLKSRSWWHLARMDMRMRYRRTALGPWWNVLGVGVALVGMSVIWATIFNLSAHEFFPYLSSGYVIWILISSLVTQGCDCFTSGNSAAIQRSQNLPKSIHIFRSLAGNVLNFGHSLTIFVAGALILGIDINWNTLLVVPGFLMLLWVGCALVTIFGVLGARYRDLQPSIGALMGVLFFITPVVFKPGMLGERAHFVTFNPLAHLLEIVRAPLLGLSPAPVSWLVVLAMAVIFSLLGFVLFARARNRIVYWL